MKTLTQTSRWIDSTTGNTYIKGSVIWAHMQKLWEQINQQCDQWLLNLYNERLKQFCFNILWSDLWFSQLFLPHSGHQGLSWFNPCWKLSTTQPHAHASPTHNGIRKGIGKTKFVGWEKNSLIIIVMAKIILKGKGESKLKPKKNKWYTILTTHFPAYTCAAFGGFWKNSPQRMYWAWCSLVQNIPRASLCQLSWPCSLPTSSASARWQSMWNWKVLDLDELCSAIMTTSVCYQYYCHTKFKIQHCATY